MFDRPCPRCGNLLGHFDKRCAICGFDRGHAAPSPIGPPRSPGSALDTSGATGSDIDGDVTLGPFGPDQLPLDAPANALVRIDLKPWHSNSREVLKERLHALVIPQRWDNEILGVLGAYLGQVAPIVRDVNDELEPSIDATGAVDLDCSALEPAALTALSKTLDESRLTFHLSADGLRVAARDRARVTRVLDDIRAGNLVKPVAPNDLEYDNGLWADGDDHAFAALDALYQAVDAVRRHPDRLRGIDELADACTRCPIGAPFGMEPAIWHDLVSEAGALAQASSDLDADEIHTRATTLYERLHDLVA